MKLSHLFTAWAFRDRIRVSPREGKLLRLPVGACLRVGGILYRVTARQRLVSDAGSVTYVCRGVGDRMTLTAATAADGSLRLRMLTGEVVTDMAADDIEVFG